MPTLEDAIAPATEAHAGQTDKAGEPYILHLLRVMQAQTTEEAMMAGVLHDLVEDTGSGFDDLRERGYPGEVIEALRHVTKRDGESYGEFAGRAGQHPIAQEVKTRGPGGQHGRDAPEDSHRGGHRAPCEVPAGSPPTDQLTLYQLMLRQLTLPG
jgi:Guanosine polyphosphate pyrophosphohydrolases/synthetases